MLKREESIENDGLLRMGKIPLSLKFKSNSKKSKPPKYSKEGTK
jgi:hypothetical protein